MFAWMSIVFKKIKQISDSMKAVLNKYNHPLSQSLCSNVRLDEYSIQKN
jgi:hypothetical protein